MTDEFVSLLAQYINIKSISTDPDFRPQMDQTVVWLTELLEKYNFSVELLSGPTCNPVVFANYFINNKWPTVLVYGHYDVQPSDQFDLQQRNGRFYGRGVVDNKGQNLIHIYTVCKLAREKKLKYNVKFLIEGNEETGNDDLREILSKNKTKLKSDIVLVSDGEIIDNRPTIESSLRGGFNVRLTYSTAKNNVHSGIYGGAIPNAALELAKLVSNISPDTSGVDKITNKQILNNKSVKVDLENLGIKKRFGKYDFYTQTGLNPTIQITGFKSGYIDNGFANIVPATAEVRLNFRIVTSQKPQAVYAKFQKFVRANTPKYVEYKMEIYGPHNPVKLNTNSKLFADTAKLLENVYNRPVFFQNVGGAIPFISDVKEIFAIDTLSVALANSDCNMHGDNENFRIDLIDRGLQFSEKFFTMHTT